MSGLRAFYLALIIIAMGATLHFVSWNIGHDVGYVSGYNTAILEGKVEVQCKFPCKDGRTREPREE